MAAWIERQTATHTAPTVKQQLAATRHLFDWLVTGRVGRQAQPLGVHRSHTRAGLAARLLTASGQYESFARSLKWPVQ
ncbi:hypothetical protein [Burkholderia lata]|uniref:hypothetical protein n=1 Tax=Burkholderia lata (strain ATCC 17760 / DSM 23089 / LMG 22485 / NCIMB 9086 / R18194 / 383) TaxID=482957 RepID=UPI0015816002